MSRAGAALSALLVALAFGASYALSAESGDRQTRPVEVPGKPASPLRVSEGGLRTGLLGSAAEIPGTLNVEPVKRKAPATAPAPPSTTAPAPAEAPDGTPEPTPPEPTPPEPTPAEPTPPPAPAPAPNPDAGTGQTFDDSG